MRIISQNLRVFFLVSSSLFYLSSTLGKSVFKTTMSRLIAKIIWFFSSNDNFFFKLFYLLFMIGGSPFHRARDLTMWGKASQKGQEKVYCSGVIFQSRFGLQRGLNLTSEYFQQWRLEINIDKTWKAKLWLWVEGVDYTLINFTLMGWSWRM